jgi:hypothetical protein
MMVGKVAVEAPYVDGKTSHVLASPVTTGHIVGVIAVDNAVTYLATL